jgi:hypothetical protein
MHIARLRLHNQHIAAPRFKRPAQIVAWLGAVQAQDFAGALWSIGLRLIGATEKDIERAIADRTIVRTWPMRGTLHFVAAADVHWMRALLTPCVVTRSAPRQRELELDASVFARCEKIFLKALRGGRQLLREEMLNLLEKARIRTAGQRGYHILWRLAQEGLLCFGPHAGKQPTFTLLDEWCPATKPLDREQSLAALATRYFTSHGPATLQDFIGWTALPAADARQGLNLAAGDLAQEVIDGKTYWFSRELPPTTKKSAVVHLLPGFDEYMLGYRDRSPSLRAGDAQKICPGSNGMFIPTVIIDGQVGGTWKRVLKKRSVSVTAFPFTSFTRTQQRTIAIAAIRYSHFLGRTIEALA